MALPLMIGMTINGAYGQQCVSQKTPLQQKDTGDFIHYFLNRDHTINGKRHPMGELFFALPPQQQNNNRLQLGKYNGQCWTENSGWVDKKYLIEGFRPITVGQAAKYPQLAQEPGVHPDSTLWLRALQKPEYYKQKPLTAPAPKNAAKKDVGLEGLAYRWRHVYAIDSVGGKLWYLVGSQSRLFFQPRKNTITSQQAVLGWVPAKNNQVLATNIGLELNTSKKAVDERINQNKPKPVILYSEARTSSDKKSTEVLEVWDDYKNGQKTTGTTAWIEPYGLDPTYPRFYVHSFDQKWYSVSTWGSIGDKLKPSDITRLAEKLQATLNRLRTVDIVVVFDRSGSMSSELQALKSWLIDFSKDLANIKADKTTKIQFFGKDEQFTVGLKIHFSLVLFEARQDYPIFTRLKLPEGLSQVINGINSITLQGGFESVFDTLTRVVPSHSGYWEDSGFSQRFILVMMDESGDIGDMDKYDVKNALPLPTNALRETGYDPSKITPVEWTKIWAMYTASSVTDFKNNVDGFIVGKRLRHISDFENSRNQAQRFRTEMQQVLNELQNEIEERAKRFGNLLIQEHQITQQGGQSGNVNVPVTMKLEETALRDAAIHAALKDAGTSLEELSAIVGVAFVEGYIPLFDQSRKNPSVQEVVVLEENELRTLRDNVFGIASQIEKSFQPNALRGGILGSIMQKVGTSNRREKIAATLLYAILATSGDTATLNHIAKMEPLDLLKMIRDWLKNNAENSIAFMMGMKTSIETGSKGLLNRPLKEIVNMDENSIRDEARLLLNKSHCMGQILKSRTIPMEVETCPSDRGIQKRWRYEQGSESYIYVPMRVIP
ncbi:hypothetical protein PN36_20935 [Candidatus Thiomargarita nelsonii]|uniref:VWFA domain-containing protein n=1 Tax=Candidatus Thiomargarita nelsonii TaxID=1003181 RepID=A0A0A6P7N0_9GAMM|nr:hypothetical protein PN36_20935 [Candidatus Thiomargarita nelsonii]